MIDRTLVVDEHGRLSCPRQGDVDADVCFSCPDLLRVGTSATGRPIVACRVVSPVLSRLPLRRLVVS